MRLKTRSIAIGRHTLSKALLNQMEPVDDGFLPPPRPRTKPVPIRFSDDIIERAKVLAARRHIGYQTLLKEFVVERLYELDMRMLLPRLAWAHLELGDHTQAAAVAEWMPCGCEAWWRAVRNAGRRPRVPWRREEDVALAHNMPYPYAEARLLHVYGQMHVEKGEQGPAHERLHASLAIFQRLGACRDAECVEQTVASLKCARRAGK